VSAPAGRTLTALALVAAWVAVARASEVREVRLGAARQWEQGRLQSVALAADGSFSLAPEMRALNLGAAAPPPYLLCQARDRDGNLYVGAGGPARVFRFSAHGNATLLFQGDEMQATALALDSKGRLYVATSPRGRVYRLGADGEAKPFFETEERYLWSLAVDPSDQVWVGSGERGRLFRVDAGGRGKLALDSPDAHITALAVEADGSVLAGTDGRGLVYRIGKDGNPRLLVEGGLRQVSALAVATERTIYVALVGPMGSAAPEARRRRTREEETPELRPGAPFEREAPLTLGEESPPLALEEALEPPLRLAPRSRILALDPSGAAREVWSADGQWLFSLGTDAAGALYFGTGEPARLYRLEAADRASLLARPEAAHVTSIAGASGGGVTLLTGRPGMVMTAGAGIAESGSLESEPQDAGAVARWGRVRWLAEIPPGARIELFSRTGNSARPDAAWSDWSAAYADASGSAIVSPSGRYLQWRVALSRGREPRAPRLRELTFSYLPANRPPRVEQVTLHPAGEYFLPEDGPVKADGRSAVPGRSARRAGVRSLTWQASDPDGDPLTAAIRVRRASAGEWSDLADRVRLPYYSWSVADMEEGWYEVQVEVSDAGPNPPETAGRAVSAPLTLKVDSTPPTIEVTRNRLADTPPVLEFRVSDTLSPVHRVELRVDTSPPRRLVPIDGLEDSPREEYRWQGSTPPGRLRLEAADTEGNSAKWQWPEDGSRTR